MLSCVVCDSDCSGEVDGGGNVNRWRDLVVLRLMFKF